MKIATYNVNSIRRRLPLVLDWIAIHKPDVMCLQETKVQDQDFPVDAFRGAGYQATYRGMKGYNGRHINDPRIHGTASEQSRTVCFHGRDELLADLENKKAPLVFGPDDLVQVPCAFAHFPKEISSPPRQWVERGYNIQRWTEMPRGGHFAAAEEPELLADDIRAFFRGLRNL